MKKSFLLCIVLLTVLVSQAQLKMGAGVPDIELPNTKDVATKLSSFQGKVVLIDFWASWCGPCRATNPYIQKLYKKYKAKGFEVFAVSLDTKKESWLKAIKNDKLLYTQVIDLEGWNSKVAEQFFVDALPTNFLLDKNGKIVAINIEGKAMFDAVKNLVE